MWCTGLVATRHVGSSQTRAQTRVPCIGRRILNHCTTREALRWYFSVLLITLWSPFERYFSLFSRTFEQLLINYTGFLHAFFFFAKCLEFAIRQIPALFCLSASIQWVRIGGGLGVVLALPFPHTRGLTGGSGGRRHIWVCLTGRRQGLGACASADGRQGAREAGTWASALPQSRDEAAAGRGCRGGGASEGVLPSPSLGPPFHGSARAANI